MPNFGFRIFPSVKRPPQKLLRGFQAIATTLISDNMNRLHAMSGDIRPYHKPARLVGVALTVKVPPGLNLVVQKAIDMALPGDVIVIDAGGVIAQAMVGEIAVSYAAQRGVAGFVIDGAIRDVAAIKASTFPIYARGVTHLGPYKDGPGEINVPVVVGGLVIQPGDILVGDEDGLVAISQDIAPAVLKLAQAQAVKEVALLRSAKNGTLSRDWVDKRLQEQGCDFKP